MTIQLWLRAETRGSERRAPLVPEHVAELVAEGMQVTVEDAPDRCFAIESYAGAGAEIAMPGDWVHAPDTAYILGIKELPDEPEELRHTHIYFAHAFKGQEGAHQTLDRFRAGGGTLLDIEYLVLDERRLAAFGYWAGYVGAGLGTLALRERLKPPLRPMRRSGFDATLGLLAGDRTLRALVVGAEGRSGHGACDALKTAGVTVTEWDRADTRELDHATMLGHDLLVNCVSSRKPGPPFVGEPELEATDRRLTMIADVTCDVTSEANLIPVNMSITTWEQPVRRLADQPPLDVIAIDNLPSLLPREASQDFSAQLARILPQLPARSGAWAAAEAAFRKALAAGAGRSRP